MPGAALRTLGWVVTLAAIAIYAFMLSVSLPHLADMSGGMPMFDMQASYDLETARIILTRLGEEGRRYYDEVQHVLDTFYPPLVALTVIYWMWRSAPRWRASGLRLPRPALWLLMGIAALAAAFDLTENALVGQMLATGPHGLTQGLVEIASTFTLAKTIAVSTSLTALLVLGVGPFVPRLMGRKV